MPEIHYLLLIALLIVSTVLWLQQRQTRNAGSVSYTHLRAHETLR